MRAVVCHRLDGSWSLRLDELPSPALGPGRVRAAAVNFADLLMTRGLYQLRPEQPFTLGLEAAGVIAETAPDVTGWRPGDRAIVRLRPGAFAEEIVLPLERAAEALELLEQRRVVGKAVLTMP